MTEDERELIFSLVIFPGEDKGISKEEFLKEFRPCIDKSEIVNDLLKESCDSKKADDVESALAVGFALGFNLRELNVLHDLAVADWHNSHEDIVSALAELKSPASVNVLYNLTQWVPGYLEFDDARALAVKAIWALAGIPSEHAQAALSQLSHSNNPIFKESAMRAGLASRGLV